MMMLIIRKKQRGQVAVIAFNGATFLSEETLLLKHFRKYGCQSPGNSPLFSHVLSFSHAMFEFESRFKSPKTTIQTQYHLLGGEIQRHKALSHPSLLAFRLQPTLNLKEISKADSAFHNSTT